MEIVVFCYRGSILLSMPIRCHFSQEKCLHPNYDGSREYDISVANYYRRKDLLPVAFFISQGPLSGSILTWPHGEGYQNRATSLLEPRVFFYTPESLETWPLEPRLEARYPFRAFRGFVPISGTPLQ